MSEEKQPKNAIPYSYHTFIFPFIFNDSGKVTANEFRRKILTDYWEPDYRKDTPVTGWEYAQYCYFNPAARSAIFTEENDKNLVVQNFRYNVGKLAKDNGWLGSLKGKNNPVCYQIHKNYYNGKNEVVGSFDAALKVNGIRLKLFDTGVGMLIFELENYDLPGEKDVILINEYGRRVFMPFMDPNGRCKLCADTISLNYPDGSVDGYISGVKPERNSNIRLMTPITFLLSNNAHSVTTEPRHEPNQLYIEPIIDDRMFVACFYRNAEFACRAADWDQEQKQYRYLTDAEEMHPFAKDNMASRLYQMMFVDGNELSCHSRTMLSDMLKDHIYQRWLEYGWEKDGNPVVSGTVTGISEFSMVCVTACSEAFVQTLIDPFLTMYIEMAILALAQRASLLAFERRISDCARGKGKVERIQKDYVLFQSRLLLREVTPQQQGIELYDMLLKNLFIDKECKDVESQIGALFTLQNETHSQWDNLLLFGLALIAVTDAVGFFFAWIKPLVHESMCADTCETVCKFISNGACEAVIAFVLIAVLIVFYVIGHLKRLK